MEKNPLNCLMKMRSLLKLSIPGKHSVQTERWILLGLLCTFGLLLAGCASGPMSSADADSGPVDHKVFYEGWGWSHS
jgi:hypothetical protein